MTNTTENIILIGMPGAGKSTLGVVLAKILGYEFIDADLLIQSKLDKTLQKIIDACGPDGFIEVENEVLCTLSTSHAIIATGGSAVYSDEAMKHLSSIGTVVYLQVSYEELENRLGGLHERGVVMKNGIGMSLAGVFLFYRVCCWAGVVIASSRRQRSAEGFELLVGWPTCRQINVRPRPGFATLSLWVRDGSLPGGA